MVPGRRLLADAAYLCIRHIVAYFAELYLPPHACYRFSKLFYLGSFLLQEMQHKTQRRFFPDTGEPGKFIYCVFYQCGRKNHMAKLGILQRRKQLLYFSSAIVYMLSFLGTVQ